MINLIEILNKMPDSFDNYYFIGEDLLLSLERDFKLIQVLENVDDRLNDRASLLFSRMTIKDELYGTNEIIKII